MVQDCHSQVPLLSRGRLGQDGSNSGIHVEDRCQRLLGRSMDLAARTALPALEINEFGPKGRACSRIRKGIRICELGVQLYT